MDAKEQAEGEKLVWALLIQPLERRGLMRPAGMKQAQFDEMKCDIAKKLAYMTRLNLAALEEVAVGAAGGSAKDRFPLGARVLERAMDIQQPSGGPSPLMLAVFASDLAADALAEDFAPEMLGYVRRNRLFPKGYVVTDIKRLAAANRHRIELCEDLERRGKEPKSEDVTLRTNRAKAVERCEGIRRQALREANT